MQGDPPRGVFWFSMDSTQNLSQNVASGRQPWEDGAQEPQHTRQYVRIPGTARPRITAAQQF
jgi:hypothetical protein